MTVELLRLAFEAAPIGLEIIVRRDEDDIGSLTPILVNQAACEASGQDLKADVGRPWNETSPDLVDSDFARMFESALDTGEPVSWELQYGDSRFEQNWFRGTAVPLDGATLVLMFEAITAQKGVELELDRSNKALDDFAYVASHDLRAPLRDVDNLAAWLREDLEGTLPPKSQEHLQKLSGRVRRMERLLDDLLQYSRAGRRPDPHVSVDLGETLRRVVEDIQPPEGFTVWIPDDTLVVPMPSQALEIVLRNLIGNAIKHHDRPDGNVWVELADVGDAVEFTVRDDGPGIAPEFHERVFQMFQSLKPRDEVGGTGLGLALVRRHVEAHGGLVALESDVGKGCRFTVTWPKRAA